MVFLDAPGKINGGRSGMWTPSLSKPGSRSADLSEGRLPSTERRGEPRVPQPGRIRPGDGFVSDADLACDVSAIWDVELRFQRSFTPDPACLCPLLLRKGTPRLGFRGFSPRRRLFHFLTTRPSQSRAIGERLRLCLLATLHRTASCHCRVARGSPAHACAHRRRTTDRIQSSSTRDPFFGRAA